MSRIRSYFSDMWSVHLDAGTLFPVSQGVFRLSFLTKLDRPLSQEPHRDLKDNRRAGKGMISK